MQPEIDLHEIASLTIFGLLRKQQNLIYISALDKPLGQMGIYATWLSSMHCVLAKTIAFFHIFYTTFFSVITRFLMRTVFCLLPTHAFHFNCFF